MRRQTATSFFIASPSEAKSAELYQVLLRGIENYQQLGNRLIQFAEQAYAFRQFDKIKEMGLMLSNLPIKKYQAIGHYFLAVATNSKGNGDQDEARKLFELTVDKAPDAYKVKGILSLGALSYNRGDFDSAFYYLQEALETGKLNLAGIQAIRGLAVLKAIEGNHRQAIKDLESILPVIKHAPAHIYFDLLNSYAVELGEVGRKDEARNIMRVVLASPFTHAYPEWRETAEDLRPARRSVVAVGSPNYNVLAMPERELSQPPTPQPKPARVLDLARWKKKMAKKAKDKQTEQLLEDMSLQDMGFKLLGLISDNRMDED
ncbi:MAG TPA: tetratricopeptide repeat protein, partial [Blastocatellia bacterium]|nr:tetratricopeptide repeat protein [Blastocatellia bacterium]